MASGHDSSMYQADGPVHLPFGFIGELFEPTPSVMWSALSDNLMLCMVQQFVWNNREHFTEPLSEAVAALLDRTHPWTAEFDRISLEHYQRDWRTDFEAGLGASNRPRPMGLDLELVLLMPIGDEPVVYDSPVEMRAFPFLMQRTEDGWVIAAFGETPPTPGLPPTF